MAHIALDADGLRRDRQRYHALLEQAELQIAAWNERADHLQQAIDGLDRLLALSGDDPVQDGGVPRGRTSSRGVPALAEAAPAPPAAVASPPVKRAVPERADKPKDKAPSARKAAPRPATATPAAPSATPAAPDPVAPPTGSNPEAPKGTDALRVVFESTPERTWSLAELIEALGTRGWLPTSRRPEEGVRISLKRLAERGGVQRTDDGRWQLAGRQDQTPSGLGQPTWPPAEESPATDAPAAQVAPDPEQEGAQPPPPPATPPPARPASFGRPVGGTITEI